MTLQTEINLNDESEAVGCHTSAASDPVSVDKILAAVRYCRVSFVDEKEAQRQLEKRFAEKGIAAKREVRLSSRDIVDFMVGGVAIEIKIKGGRMDIYRQLERYAEYGSVSEILLLTGRSMGLPDRINGKPARVYSLSQAWL